VESRPVKLETPTKLPSAYTIEGHGIADIPFNRFGDLIVSFQRYFPVYSLFIRFYCENTRRKEYTVLVMRSTGCYEDTAIPDHELTEMRRYIQGFAEGCAHGEG